MVEIYNETVIDLLSDSMGSGMCQNCCLLDSTSVGKPPTCQISSGRGIHNVQGATEMQVITTDDVHAMIDRGQKNRTVAATKVNGYST